MLPELELKSTETRSEPWLSCDLDRLVDCKRCAIIFQAAAAGEIQEAGLAAWFKRHTKKSRR
jgi:hypothetical protein